MVSGPGLDRGPRGREENVPEAGSTRWSSDLLRVVKERYMVTQGKRIGPKRDTDTRRNREHDLA